MRIPHLPLLQKIAGMLGKDTVQYVAPLKETHLDPKDIVDVVDPSPQGAKALAEKQKIQEREQKRKRDEGEKRESQSPEEGHLDIQV